MKQNELKAKIHELEGALNERREEIARTKTSEAEIKELVAIRKRVESLIEGVYKLKSEQEKREFIRQADELLLELHRS